MLKCGKCGHQNLPTYESCSACGTPLAGGAAAGPVGGGDEYARLMVARAQAQARNRKVVALAGAAALVLGGFVWYRDYQQKQARQEKLDFFERWAELEKRETGSFFNCAMASEIDMNLVSNAQQIQMKIESAFATQQKTFSDYLLTDCVPKIERARQAFGGLRDTPAEFGEPLGKYTATLPKLQAGIEEYADKIKNRKEVRDVDQLVQELGNAWHSSDAATPEAIAFEKFMHCAIPGLAKMKDAQQMLEYLADACYKRDPVAFMDKVRKDCGPLLANVDTRAKPSATWGLSQKRFYEQEARQLQAWDSCARRSRKGKKVDDLSTFLLAVGEYMEARAGVVKTARDIRGDGR